MHSFTLQETLKDFGLYPRRDYKVGRISGTRLIAVYWLHLSLIDFDELRDRLRDYKFQVIFYNQVKLTILCNIIYAGQEGRHPTQEA